MKKKIKNKQNLNRKATIKNKIYFRNNYNNWFKKV
jgi:hypothetical protein